MVEGWWCETSRGHFLRGCLNGCALQELPCGGAVLGRAPADRDWTVLFWVVLRRRTAGSRATERCAMSFASSC
jgi:hypothetical protein